MKNFFDLDGLDSVKNEFPGIDDDLALLIYTSRLIGREPDLVLHGGGNSSMKVLETDIFGEPLEVLYIKGSGMDLFDIGPDGFCQLDNGGLQRLMALDELSDEDMGNYVNRCRVSASTPNPSVETLLHGFLPFKFVFHSHADSILVLTNSEEGEDAVKDALGDKMAVVPHAKSGLPLAKAVHEAWFNNKDIDGVVVLNHGVFTFSDDAEKSCGLMFEYVTRAEDFIKARMEKNTDSDSESIKPEPDELSESDESNVDSSKPIFLTSVGAEPDGLTADDSTGDPPAKVEEPGLDAPESLEQEPDITNLIRVAQIIRGVCRPAIDGDPEADKEEDGGAGGDLGTRVAVALRTDPEVIEASVSEDADFFCESGVLTTDHAIRTKNMMLYLEDVPEDEEELIAGLKKAIKKFETEYELYYARRASGGACLGASPVVFLIKGLGLITVGTTQKDAEIAADIGVHTLRCKLQAAALGGYVPIDEDDVFAMEAWTCQLKKKSCPLSAKSGSTQSDSPLTGQTALITGVGGAIGFGIARTLLATGANVIISDIHEPSLDNSRDLLVAEFGETSIERVAFDVTDFDSVTAGFERGLAKFGGLDILVPNAGVAHVARIEDLDQEKFEQVIKVNLLGTFTVIKAAIPIFKRQGTGGNIVLISTKNVFDPGAAFGAYSASKAGAHQISKIAAIELAELGVRVNMVNPDAVFGDEKVCSKLWEVVGPDRMKARGLDPQGLQDYYCNRSLLKTQVLAEHVGNAVVFFASELTPTTGAALAVDGGNANAFPR